MLNLGEKYVEEIWEFVNCLSVKKKMRVERKDAKNEESY